MEVDGISPESLAAPQVKGLDFSIPEITESCEHGRLLRLTLELEAAKCDLRCRYCWNDSSAGEVIGIHVEESRNVIEQATSVGARTLVVTGGGEPMLNLPRFFDVLSTCESLGLWVVVYTNGLSLTRGLCEDLKPYPVSLVTKLHSLDNESATDWLCGVAKSHGRLKKSVENLLEAGWALERRQGIHTVVLRRNFQEIVPLWRWCREHGIVIYVEIPKRMGRAKALSQEEFLTVPEVGRLFEKLSGIDRDDYGCQWLAHPPIAPLGCDKWLYSVYVSSSLDVYPCAGVRLPLGNLRKTPLQEILGSDNVRRMRNVRSLLGGRCTSCKLNTYCYGCRANAFEHCGHMYSEDPACWIQNDGRAHSPDPGTGPTMSDHHGKHA